MVWPTLPSYDLAGLEGPEHPHLQKMLELFTTQWSSFVAKEKKAQFFSMHTCNICHHSNQICQK